MLLFVTLLAIIFGLLYAYLKYYYDYWVRRGIPSERPTLVIGSLKGIGKTLQFRDVNQRIYERFKGGVKPFTGMFFFFTKAALITDLDLIKSILIRDFSNFPDRGLYHNTRDDPLTGHLVNIDGEQWRSLRHKLTPVFTSGKMKFMFPTVVAVSERLIEACETVARESPDGAFEMKELCARYTTDVIGTCAFGLECNSLKDPNAEFREKGRSVFEKPRHSQLIQALIFLTPNLARLLRLRIYSDEVNDFFMNAVRSTVEYRTKNKIRRNDFMDMLIEMKAKDEDISRCTDGIDLSYGLTLEQIAAQAFVFFVGGFDTSSTTMSFCLYELALNQEIQSKAREEITNVLENHNSELTYEALSEMSYLDQILDETLRKYPVLPHLVRKSIADYKVPGTNTVIEAGTTIIIPMDAIQHDPEYYPDPEKFDPSRFESEEVQQRHSSLYLPFGDGPRSCIGMRFGKMQAKVGLVTMLRNFKFTKSSRTVEPLEFSKTNFVLSAKDGLYVHAERLKRAS